MPLTEDQKQRNREACARWREKNREYERERGRKFYQEHKEERYAKSRRWIKANPEKVAEYGRRARANAKPSFHNSVKNRMFQAAKKRAKLRNIPFDITVHDIEIPTHCPIFGIELECGKGVAVPSSPSLDRIKPELGYIRGNIQVISFRANYLKSNATIEELQKILDYAKSLF